jgi:hypothetical protein
MWALSGLPSGITAALSVLSRINNAIKNGIGSESHNSNPSPAARTASDCPGRFSLYQKNARLKRDSASAAYLLKDYPNGKQTSFESACSVL